MDTRKITLIATIAAIALVAVGIGYAYTATTTNSSNTVANEYATIQLADNSSQQAYTVSTNINIEYNTKTVYENSTTKYKYDVVSNEDLTAVKKVTLGAVNGSSADKTLSSLTLTLAITGLSTAGYTSDSFTATLVDSESNSWTGTATVTDSNIVWSFTTSSGNTPVSLKAGITPIDYTLTLQLKSTTNYPYSAPITSGTYSIDFLATVA